MYGFISDGDISVSSVNQMAKSMVSYAFEWAGVALVSLTVLAFLLLSVFLFFRGQSVGKMIMGLVTVDESTKAANTSVLRLLFCIAPLPALLFAPAHMISETNNSWLLAIFPMHALFIFFMHKTVMDIIFKTKVVDSKANLCPAYTKAKEIELQKGSSKSKAMSWLEGEGSTKTNKVPDSAGDLETGALTSFGERSFQDVWAVVM